MLILLLLVAFTPSNCAPTTSSLAYEAANSFGTLLQSAATLDQCNTRSTPAIIWSCLATISACTWVAVHPNIPGLRESPWLRFRRQCTTMFYAIIAPEMMTLWAMRQRYAAEKIKREYNEKYYPSVRSLNKRSCGGYFETIKMWFRSPDEDNQPLWTLSHGFFIQMGGFVYAPEGKPSFVLTFTKLQELVKLEVIDLPSVTAADIQDKSKGDFLTKLLVMTQTTWFIVQCIVRWCFRLEVTELEVVTLAFAVLNIITYVLWWAKPQHVETAILIPKKHNAPSLESSPLAPRQSWLERKIAEGGEGTDSWLPWIILVTLLLPMKLLRGLFIPLGKMATEDQVDSSESTRVPMFYAEHDITQEPRVIFPALSMSVVFGGIHLISWTSQFPSDAEKLLWRIAAIAITFEPLPVAVGAGLYKLNAQYRVGSAIRMIMEAVAMSLGSIAFIGVPVYIISRLTLLVLALSTLRNLGPKALADLSWSDYVPHI